MFSARFTVILLLCLDLAFALPIVQPRRTRKTGTNASGSSNSGLPATSTATDGSVILEDEVVINGLSMRFKVSGPANQFVANSQTGARATGNLGVNILFHGDGGQSFVDFPNQGVNGNLMGVALLAPDPNFRWGGADPNDQTGLVRPDGQAHSAAVNQFITQVLPTVVNFDPSQVFLEGVSGGSLLLSGFMIPQFAASLGVPGAVLGCGGLKPQVQVQGDISGLRLHFQSTTDDLPDLKQSIPVALSAYEQLITDPTLLTADASPNGGHCEFDQRDFVSGVQLLTDNFSDILAGTGTLNGVAVANPVAGNENLFAASSASTGRTKKGRTARVSQ